MLQDFRYACRNLGRTPLFTLVALLSLALGIGANSAVFTIADQVLLRLMPVKHARELVFFTSPGPQNGMIWGENRFSYPMFKDFRDNNSVFNGVAAHFNTPLNLSYNNRSEQIQAEIVSGTWFDTLGIDTIIGRGIAPYDDLVPGGHSVAVLTYDFWRSRFGGDRSILNKILLLNGHPMTVIGVAAPGYRGFDVGTRTDILVPTMMKAQMTPTWNGLDDRRIIWLQLVGCLKPGVTAQQAQASLEPYYRSLLNMEVQSMTLRSSSRQRFVAKPLIFVPAAQGVSDFRDQISAPLFILLAIVALLLLIACANVANLLLARSVARQREIAIRLAVGASRMRLVRQLVVESVVLSLGGGALGVIFAAWTSGTLLGLLANSSDLGLTSSLDWRVFAFTFLLAVLTGVIFGLVPALQTTSPSLARTLKDQAGSVSGGSGHVRLRKALVISQVGLSLLMLIAATLFARSLHNLKNVDLGFRRDSLMSFAVDPSLNAYPADRIRHLAEDIQQRLGALPGVRSAAIGVNPVIAGNVDMSTIKVEGYQPKEDESMNPYVDHVSPGYFSTMGIPLMLGREFTATDRLGAPKVAIVNDVFAKYYFKNESPLGRRFGFARDKAIDIQIVGVVHSSKYESVNEKPQRVLYTPFLQETNPSSLMVYARSSADPRTLFAPIRREINALDSSLPINNMHTMEEQVDQSLSAQRLLATLSAFFGILATLLAAIGLYGVMAYTVSRRTRELGIRVALGAGRSSLLGLVMREVAVLTGAGVVIAIPVALVLTRLVRSQLYGVLPSDVLSIAIAAASLIAVAMLAGYIPAERATRVNPISALRYE
ncbi:MAG TPA: ABC transporter permease [Bryobacteraceae bacterium]